MVSDLDPDLLKRADIMCLVQMLQMNSFPLSFSMPSWVVLRAIGPMLFSQCCSPVEGVELLVLVSNIGMLNDVERSRFNSVVKLWTGLPGPVALSSIDR